MAVLRRCFKEVHVQCTYYDIGVYHLKLELLLSGCKERGTILGNVAALERCLMYGVLPPRA